MQKLALWVFVFTIMLILILTTLFALPATSSVQETAAIYQGAPSVTPDLRLVLASFGTQLSPQELATLSARLGTNPHTINSSSNLVSSYLGSITKAASQLAMIKSLLHDANQSLGRGDIDTVNNDIQVLNRLSSDTRGLLNSSMVYLNQISATYGINVTTQNGQVKQLYTNLQEDLLQINHLRIEASLRRTAPTTLSLDSSATNILVEENLTATGFLKWKGIPLPGRLITVSWGLANESAVTNSTGGFKAQFSFPFGTPSGPAVVAAFFQPTGNDTLAFQSAYAATQINVGYEPTEFHATLINSTLKPTETTLIYGNLTATSGLPLRDEEISINFNSAVVGHTSTLANGAFYFILTVPEIVRNGTYTASLIFAPTTGTYAPSSYDLRLSVVTIPSEINLRTASNLSFSGTNVTLFGSVSYPNQTVIRNGVVSIYIDNAFYANTTASLNGTFDYSLKLPILANLGYHAITVKFTPSDPTIDESQSTLRVYVVNTPITILTTSSLIIGSVAIGVSLSRRRTSPQRPAPARALPSAESEAAVRQQLVLPAQESYEMIRSKIRAESDDGLKVRKAYTLARLSIDTRLRETSRPSETTSEYLLRVTSKLPKVTSPLRELSKLYEIAEYSQFEITNAQSASALNNLEVIRKQITE